MKLTEVRYRKSFQLSSGSYVTLELAAEPDSEGETAVVMLDKLRKVVAQEAQKEVPVSKTDELNQRIQAQRVTT